MQLKVGSIVDGKVTGVTEYGAFVDLGEGKVGLVHISEVSGVFVEDISEHVKKGQKIKVKILKIRDNGKIELSMKRADEKWENKKTVVNKARAKKQQNFTPTNSFEDMINEFKKASDERLFDANKKVEQRRGKSYHKGNA